MTALGVHNNVYSIAEREIPVVWESSDFSGQVISIPNGHIREVLLDSGVMYVAAADPKIHVSHLLHLDLQGLSAVHEELCMEQKLAACPDVEGIVIDTIANTDLKSRFIAMRLRMFGALCLMDSGNEQFAATHQLLVERASTH